MATQRERDKANGEHSTHVPVETWTDLQPRRDKRVVASTGEVELPQRKRHRKWWQRMSEISDKTKVTLQIGGAFVIAAALLMGGKYWGSFENEAINTKATLVRHEAALIELRAAVTDINAALIRNEASNKAALDAANRADGKGTAILLEMASLREALASRGITVRPQKEE